MAHEFKPGEYTLRCGDEAKVYEVLECGRIMGARRCVGGTWVACHWWGGGRFCQDGASGLDLAPPEPKTLEYARRDVILEWIAKDACRDITDERRHHMSMPIEHVAELAYWLSERLKDDRP